MTTWILALFLNSDASAPAVIAKGYRTADECLAAGELLKTADSKARGYEGPYTVSCTEKQE